jgi:hypothetical protein
MAAPDKIVFLGKHANIDRQFRGWSYARELLPRLLAAHPQYARSLNSALAAARQWQLVEPMATANPADTAMPLPIPPPWLSGRLVSAHVGPSAPSPVLSLHDAPALSRPLRIRTLA